SSSSAAAPAAGSARRGERAPPHRPGEPAPARARPAPGARARTHQSAALLASELAAQDLVHLRRIRLALARLHHLADQELQRLFLAGAIVLHLFRAQRDRLVHQLLDLARIADLLQAALLDHRIDLAL